MKNRKIDQWRKVTFVPWLSSVSFSLYIHLLFLTLLFCHSQIKLLFLLHPSHNNHNDENKILSSSCLFLCLQRVEKASEFGVPEVFSRKKPAAGTCLAPPLESSDLLKDQDDAHTEGRPAKEK